QLGGELLADSPGGAAGQGARIDRVEVAPGWQHVGHPARRRPARPGRNVAAIQRPQEIADLVFGTAQVRHQLVADEAEHLLYLPPGLAGRRGRQKAAQRRDNGGGRERSRGLSAVQTGPLASPASAATSALAARSISSTAS